MSTATANGEHKGAQAAAKQQFKPSTAGKSLDGARKQAGSPVDGQNRSVASMPSNRLASGSVHLPASPPCFAPLGPTITRMFASVIKLYFGRALSFTCFASRPISDADNAFAQETNPCTTQSLDWHQPYYSATDELAQPRQWLRQISASIFGPTTAQRQCRVDIR